MDLLLDSRQTLDGFRRGDPAALAEVYWHYVGDVEKFIRRGFVLKEQGYALPGVTSPAEHADVVQEVFSRAFTEKSRLSYNGLTPFLPYLLRIARNLLVDRWRAQRREAPLPDGFEGEFVAEAVTLGQELDRDPEWQSASQATTAFIAELPEIERQFVVLRFEQGCTQAEVGEKLGLTRKQVRIREEKLCDRLSAYLAARGLGEK